MHSSEHRRDFACWMTIKASELRIQITIEDKRIHWQIKFMTQGCAKTEHSHLGPCRFPPTMNRLKGAAVLPISTSHDTLIDHWVWRRRISFGSKFTGSKFRHLSISRRCVLVLYARRGSSRYVHSYLLSNCCTVDVRKKVTLHTTREAWQKELPSIFLLLSFSLGFALRQSPLFESNPLHFRPDQPPFHDQTTLDEARQFPCHYLEQQKTLLSYTFQQVWHQPSLIIVNNFWHWTIAISTS